MWNRHSQAQVMAKGNYVTETKFDGHRVLIHKENAVIRYAWTIAVHSIVVI